MRHLELQIRRMQSKLEEDLGAGAGAGANVNEKNLKEQESVVWMKEDSGKVDVEVQL